jgi:lathosterol oxidase
MNPLKTPLESYKYEFHTNVLTTTAVETMTYLFIKTHIIDVDFSRPMYSELIYFIPLSFLFELIFDFFHYSTHRLLHHPYLYKFLHKKHHKFKHPIAITTFYQEPLDLIITNSLPTIATLLIVPQFTYVMFHFIIVYKNFIEISGHSGKKLYPNTSFSQFMWLPKWLHIELYSEEHDLHHSLNNCNYSKRFSIWDKAFNTYSRDE